MGFPTWAANWEDSSSCEQPGNNDLEWLNTSNPPTLGNDFFFLPAINKISMTIFKLLSSIQVIFLIYTDMIPIDNFTAIHIFVNERWI